MLFIRVFARVEKRMSVKQLENEKQDGMSVMVSIRILNFQNNQLELDLVGMYLPEILKIHSKKEFWKYTL